MHNFEPTSYKIMNTLLPTFFPGYPHELSKACSCKIFFFDTPTIPDVMVNPLETEIKSSLRKVVKHNLKFVRLRGRGKSGQLQVPQTTIPS